MTHLFNYKKQMFKNILIISSFLLISLLSIVILFHNHIITNIGDAQFHLKRIAELSEDFRHYNFLPTFAFNQFNGSAVMSIYPYLNLYPVVLLSLLLRSKILVMFLLFIFNTFIGLLISFYSSKQLTKNIYTSYLFSIIYIVSPIYIGYSFRIFDLGSSYAYIFAPLVVFGFLKIIINNKNHGYLELASGLTLMLYSHVPDTVIFIAFLMLWIIIDIKRLNITILCNFFKAICLSICLAGLYLVPFIYFLIYNHKIVHFTNPVMPQGISISSFVKTALSNDDVMGIGIFAIIAIALIPFFYKRLQLYARQMYWLSLIIIVVCSSLIKWTIMPLFIIDLVEHFQFMYRFLLLPILLLDYLFAYVITHYFVKKKILFNVIIILAIFLQIMGQGYYVHKFGNRSNHVKENVYLLNDPMSNSKEIKSVINKRPNGTNNNGIVTSKTTGSDYYPKASFSKLNYINNNNGYSKNEIIHFKNVGHNKFYFYSKNNEKILNIPFLKYKSEDINLVLDHHIIRTYVNRNSMVVIRNINKGPHEIYIYNSQKNNVILFKYIFIILGLIWIMILYLIK